MGKRVGARHLKLRDCSMSSVRQTLCREQLRLASSVVQNRRDVLFDRTAKVGIAIKTDGAFNIVVDGIVFVRVTLIGDATCKLLARNPIRA